MVPRIRRSAALLLALLPAGALARPAAAQVALGPELQVNTYTTSAQAHPAVAAGPAGEFVIAWDSYGQDNPGCYVYQGALCHRLLARRFDAAGQPLGGEIEVTGGGDVELAAVAKDGAGNFVVAGDDDLYYFFPGNVVARRFDSAGAPLGAEFLANGGLSGAQRNAAVAADAAGGFVVVWEYQSNELVERGIYGRRFDPLGVPVGGDFAIQGATFDQHRDPAVAMSDSGGFVVVWQDSSLGVAARRYDENGQPAGPKFAVAPSGAATDPEPAVAMDGAGNFVVAWTRIGASGLGVAARRFDAAGVPLGDPFAVNIYTTDDQRAAAVALDDAGRFLVVWYSQGQDASEGGIVAQAFDADGLPVGGEFEVNSYTTGLQSRPAVGARQGGRFLVAWGSAGQDGSSEGVFARLVRTAFFADGFEAGDACAWSATVGGGCI